MFNCANIIFYKLHASSFEGYVIKICTPIKFIKKSFLNTPRSFILLWFCIIYRVSYLGQIISYCLLASYVSFTVSLLLPHFIDYKPFKFEKRPQGGYIGHFRKQWLIELYCLVIKIKNVCFIIKFYKLLRQFKLKI